MSKLIDLTGQKFGRLTVIERAIWEESDNRCAKWLCQCQCGQTKVVSSVHLRNGNTRSCGCLSKELASERGQKSRIGQRSLKHGDFGTKLYGVWAGMKRRCQNPNTKYYADYGGRGIEVCKPWQEYINFKEWAIEAGYREGLSIDRVDVDGDYCPENCRWIPLKEQNSNKRISIKLEYKGRQYSIKEIARMTGLKTRTIQERYKRGWSVEKIIQTKVDK